MKNLKILLAALCVTLFVNFIAHANIEYGNYKLRFLDDETVRLGSEIDSGNYQEFDSDGFRTSHGDARALKRLETPVNNFSGVGVNPATAVTYGLDGAFRFSKTIDESISIALARTFDIDDSVAPSFAIGWASPATSGTCVWQLEVLYRKIDEDWSSTTPDNTIELEVNPSTTADGLVITQFTLPQLESDDAGIVIRITRLGSDGDDDMDDVAYLFGGALDYTSDRIGLKIND